MTASACPDPELLAACVEGRLQGDERDRVLRHLVRCRDCYAVFTEAMHLLESPALDAARALETTPAADATDDAAAQARPAPEQPADPPLSGDEPRGAHGNLIPFDRRRWRRRALLALPQAAVLLVALTLVWRRPPSPSAPPSTLAHATPAAPASAAASEASPAPARAASLFDPAQARGSWLTEQPEMLESLAPAPLDVLCRYAGARAVEIEVAAADPALAAQLLLRMSQVLRQHLADRRWSTSVARLAGEARAGRVPEPAALRPEACAPGVLDVARAVKLVHLAALTKSAALLGHPEVKAGLEGGATYVPARDRSVLKELARAAAAPPPADHAGAWRRLGMQAQALVDGWQP